MGNKRISELTIEVNPKISDLIALASDGVSKRTTLGSITTAGLTAEFADVTINGDLTVYGTETIISSSTLYDSGSTIFGNTSDDRHEFTGSVHISGITELGGNIVPLIAKGATLGTVDRPFSEIFLQSGSISIESDTPGDPSALISNKNGNLEISVGGMSLVQPNASFIAPTGSFEYLSGSFNHIGSAFRTGNTIVTGSFSVTGSTTQIGNNTLAGNTTLSGSVDIVGNTTIEGTTTFSNSSTTITGSLLVSGSTTQIGNNTLDGNTTLSGSVDIVGNTTIEGTTTFSNSSTTITGSLLVSGSTTQIGNNTLDGNTTLSGTVEINGDTLITGSIDITNGVKSNGTEYSSSLFQSSSISGSVIQFTKGDETTQSVTIPKGLGYSGLGWARYNDTTYTTSSAFDINDGVDVKIPCNSSSSIETHMHSSVPFFNPITQRIQTENEGDVYSITIDFSMRATRNPSDGDDIRLSMNNTVGTPYSRASRDLHFAKKDTSWHKFHEIFQYYADADFVANGNEFNLQPRGVDVEVADVIIFIQRTQNHSQH